MRRCLWGVVGVLACLLVGTEVPREGSGLRRHLVFLREDAGVAAQLEALSGDRGAQIRALQARASAAQAALLARRGGVRLASTRRPESNWLANALILDLTPEEAEAFAEDPAVDRVVPDREITLELPEDLGRVRAPGDSDESTWGLRAIRALEAREAHGVDGSGVVVGILDTGYDPRHPDLQGKLMRFKDFVQGKGGAYDDNGHGTHCAGTIGGGAASGMAIGVAPGVRFVAGKIFTRHGGGQLSTILRGMEWVVDPDGKPGSGDEPALVSNSWGGGPGSEVFRSATQAWVRLGIFPVFAAGNAGPRPGSVGVPGGYPESFAVAASTVQTEIAQFSSRGPVRFDGQELIKPDVAAPGRDVTSAIPGGGYRALSGTSMACPHVAGVTALLLQKKPDLDLEDLRYVLEETAVQHGDGEGKNNDWGHGLIDSFKALQLVSDPAR